MEKAKEFIEREWFTITGQLFSLMKIESVSAKPELKKKMYEAADYWQVLLLDAGVDTAEVIETAGNPVTYGEKIIDPKAPTIMVYAHMDVMPAEPLNLWKYQPFEPREENGYILGRGANDDKGQSFIQLKAFEYLAKNNLLKVNVKFIIEGEEEVGSPSLAGFLEKHKDQLACDFILVSDTNMAGIDMPGITTGLRGLAYWEIEVKGPSHDLHSGIFGGAVANPANVLASMLANVHNADGAITIPGFYDKVRELSYEERAKINEATYNETDYKASLGVSALHGENGYSTLERTGIRPTFDICGIWSGYTGEGTKTVLPAVAKAKISSRLVPNQSYAEMAALVKDFFEQNMPEGVTVTVKDLHGGDPYECPADFVPLKAAEQALFKIFGKPAVHLRSGGSIPIISTFEKILGVKTLLIGFGLGSDAIHSPNENFSINNLKKGIESMIQFYIEYQQNIGK